MVFDMVELPVSNNPKCEELVVTFMEGGPLRVYNSEHKDQTIVSAVLDTNTSPLAQD